MSANVPNLPEPDSASKAHTQKVARFLRDIITNEGPTPFDQFMNIALYEPGLGYYAAGSHKFGAGGDFITAPELSLVFSHCVANYCAKVLRQVPGDILEFGAGTGAMAAQILASLETLECLPAQYRIMEVSADLKQRQQQTLQARVPHLMDRLVWCERLPESGFEGVVLANEVLDAMPVKKLRIDQGQVQEYYVELGDQGQFQWRLLPSTHAFPEAILALGDAHPYDTEINPNIDGWIKALAQCLRRGHIVLIDYGFLQHEYYHPQRSMGTLKCHYRHHAHDDPLVNVGIQDITAHVDFTQVGEAAERHGLSVLSFRNQARFLLDNGLLEIAQKNPTVEVNQQIKTLTLPQEMGEIFKVMTLGGAGIDI